MCTGHDARLTASGEAMSYRIDAARKTYPIGGASRLPPDAGGYGACPLFFQE